MLPSLLLETLQRTFRFDGAAGLSIFNRDRYRVAIPHGQPIIEPCRSKQEKRIVRRT